MLRLRDINLPVEFLCLFRYLQLFAFLFYY